MARSRRWLALLLVWALLPIPPLSAQTGTVEDVLVTGLNRMTREAFLHAFGVRPGEPYDRKAVLRGYRNLWDLGLFEDLVVETETGPKGGTVLVVKLVERAVLSSVDYEENKVLTRTAIEDRLKERKASLDLGKPLSLKNVAAAEQIIRDMLGEKGFLAAEVSHKIDEITKTSRGVRFSIRPGGKTRIDEIDFVGNTVFSDHRLRSELKLNSARHWYMPWSSKSLYHPLKWDQDANKIRELYQNEGYLDVEIRPPVVDDRHVAHARELVADRLEAGEERGVVEHRDLGPTVRDQVGELLGGRGVVERDRRGAHEQAAQVEDVELGPVAQEDDDAVSPLDADVAQRAGDPARLLRVVGPGQLTPRVGAVVGRHALPQRDRVGARPELAHEPLGDRGLGQALDLDGCRGGHAASPQGSGGGRPTGVV